jgi:hypothetical protein
MLLGDNTIARIVWISAVLNGILPLQVFSLGYTAVPAILPIQNKPREASVVNLETRHEAHAEVIEGHLIFVGCVEKHGDVGGDGEEKIVVEWRKFGKLFLKDFWSRAFGVLLANFLNDRVLHRLREDFLGEITKPRLEHGRDDVDIVELGLVEKINVKNYNRISHVWKEIRKLEKLTFVEAVKPIAHLALATRNSVKAFMGHASVVEEIYAAIGNGRKPKFRLVFAIF